MVIEEIKDKLKWDSFVCNSTNYTFLHSWNWGEFNKSLGNQIYRYCAINNGIVLGVIQIIENISKRGNFYFIPHGPISEDIEVIKELIKFASNLATINNKDFIRISPILIDSDINSLIFNKNNFINAPTLMHSEDTWIIDISKDEQTILREMRKTHRYLIRQAVKNNVQIEINTEIEELPNLIELQYLTSVRHHFVPFSKEYLYKEFESFKPDDRVFIVTGKYENQICASALIIVYGKVGFYLHSGSINTNIGINHLLQWEVIKELKRRGCHTYNLWGIAPANKLHHKWRGITDFKSGFGGKSIKYMHAQDRVFKLSYAKTWLIEKIPRRWIYNFRSLIKN